MLILTEEWLGSLLWNKAKFGFWINTWARSKLEGRKKRITESSRGCGIMGQTRSHSSAQATFCVLFSSVVESYFLKK